MSDTTRRKSLETSPDTEAHDNSFLFKYHQQAMAKLAQGTGITIATLLAIPDAIALIPTAPSLVGWGIELLRIWLVALILWFAGFFIVLHLVRLITKGIAIKENGIKLWRFGKPINWSQIQAVGLEYQKVFSKLFFLSPDARRLTLYLTKSPGGGVLPQYIASFFYLPEEFDLLFANICQRRFGFVPDNLTCLVCPASQLATLRKTSEFVRWQRILLSVVIAFSLLLFLGRKAMVNYIYASANKSFAYQEFAKAKHLYLQCTTIDPTFAPAWHNLASAEYKLGNFELAEEHWQRALFLKPDFVEPKVSLAHLCIQQRQFSLAADLLEHALRLAPTNSFALVNLADLKMRLGDTTDALKLARQVLLEEPDNQLANCLMAQGKLRLGRPKDALEIITKKSHSKFSDPFCQLVAGEVFLGLGRTSEAIALFESILNTNPNNAEALLELGKAKIDHGDLLAGEKLLSKAHKVSPNNPWPQLLKAELQLKVNNRYLSKQLLNSAISHPDQDALSLALAAKLALKLGDDSEATRLAQMSLHIVSNNPKALAIIEDIKRIKR